jgi:hypothetical protein
MLFNYDHFSIVEIFNNKQLKEPKLRIHDVDLKIRLTRPAYPPSTSLIRNIQQREQKEEVTCCCWLNEFVPSNSTLLPLDNLQLR